jgi:hypothetical protein
MQAFAFSERQPAYAASQYFLAASSLLNSRHIDYAS